ncbi:MAG: HxsD-like protein [Deltaproteobacteria bacterium]|nr:HxsD-like protein [Deltaproteobacteria bacterium]
MAERLVFDRSLYLPEAVEAAAAAYGDYARIEVTASGEATEVLIADVAELDPQMVARAFANHVLHETILRVRQSARPENA